jgi:hypothetical protein
MRELWNFFTGTRCRGQSKEKSHFDTNHHQTVLWETGKEGEAAQKLKDTIRVTLPSEAKLTDE